MADLSITKLNGYCNAVYKVSLSKSVEIGDERMRTLLYRKFLVKDGGGEIAAAVFQAMSDSGLGPKLIFANEVFRIEHFVDGRALSVWEMRNPQIMKQVAKAIYHFHHSSGAADKVLGLKPINKDKLAIDH